MTLDELVRELQKLSAEEFVGVVKAVAAGPRRYECQEADSDSVFAEVEQAEAEASTVAVVMRHSGRHASVLLSPDDARSFAADIVRCADG
jgi:hypothetical protein